MSGIGKEFMEGTKYHRMGKSAHRLAMPPPVMELEWDRTKRPIPLPPPATLGLGAMSLRAAIEQRRSLREYSGQPLSLDELSYLLWCTQGVQDVAGRSTIRTVPSAGARHAFETLLCVNHVTELPPGLYRFLAVDHALVEENLAPWAVRMTTTSSPGAIAPSALSRARPATATAELGHAWTPQRPSRAWASRTAASLTDTTLPYVSCTTRRARG